MPRRDRSRDSSIVRDWLLSAFHIDVAQIIGLQTPKILVYELARLHPTLSALVRTKGDLRHFSATVCEIRLVGEVAYNEQMPDPESYRKFADAVAKGKEAHSWRVANSYLVPCGIQTKVPHEFWWATHLVAVANALWPDCCICR